MKLENDRRKKNANVAEKMICLNFEILQHTILKDFLWNGQMLQYTCDFWSVDAHFQFNRKQTNSWPEVNSDMICIEKVFITWDSWSSSRAPCILVVVFLTWEITKKQNKGYIREESGLVFREIGKYMFVEIGKYTCLEIYGKYFGNEMIYK